MIVGLAIFAIFCFLVRLREIDRVPSRRMTITFRLIFSPMNLAVSLHELTLGPPDVIRVTRSIFERVGRLKRFQKTNWVVGGWWGRKA